MAHSDSDAETLQWTCACRPDTTKGFKYWQFPIPFQLCRKQFASCLRSCQSTQARLIEQEQKMHRPANKRTLRQRSQRDDLFQDMDAFIGEDELESMDEMRLWRHISKVQVAEVSRGAKQQKRANLHQKQETKQVASYKHYQNKKKRHNQEAKARRRHDRVMEQHDADSDEKGDHNAEDNDGLFETMALDGPPVGKNTACVSQCRRQYACGTSRAPLYQNLRAFVANSDSAKDGNGRAKELQSGACVKRRPGHRSYERLRLACSCAVALVASVLL
ncbi:hypothetical protein BC939DRAFT_467647 [Gamsiella multidivaricata]|uniref:uncharacterized protein n=1 Tax=Gamsiella multidivaricata TaxID=101098 RepID=UPI00221F222F|nr:uncharacterized protein BC939DRAFT_467647 [Gamsiella multidivaricata]KAI7816887.1 hypothetical protein BC939DRAFT_467647 [Gamsiella multidivaricata]